MPLRLTLALRIIVGQARTLASWEEADVVSKACVTLGLSVFSIVAAVMVEYWSHNAMMLFYYIHQKMTPLVAS